ncbi:hypothetical protein PDO_4297, partial [Rhizobium sp. PDO1-076]|uniref:hypothetical protein n=2 Tax=Rhizobium TaxID=379 RepID=UPI00024E3A9C
MAKMSIEKRQAATKQAAFNLLDDLQHMRDVVAKIAITSGDLRRLSNVLRRLLIDESGDLPKVASPRLGRTLFLTAPDIDSMTKQVDEEGLYFASLGASKIFGSRVEVLTMYMNWIQPYQGKDEHIKLEGMRGEPDTELKRVKIEEFLRQKVLFFANTWFTRVEILKYVSNIAGGVHSGELKTTNQQNLHRLRQLVSYVMHDGVMGMQMHTAPFRSM